MIPLDRLNMNGIFLTNPPNDPFFPTVFRVYMEFPFIWSVCFTLLFSGENGIVDSYRMPMRNVL